MTIEMIGKGAEANVYQYGKLIKKERISKSYRIKELDTSLRLKRTKREAKLMSLARRAGVPTPIISDVDTISCTIEMNFINGKKINKLLSIISKNERRELCSKIGNHTGKLHSNNIIHGDLTTSNMIKYKNKIYFIDFGLGDVSVSLEDKGVDLLLFKKVLHSTHFKFKKESWNGFIEGYSKVYKDYKNVLLRLQDIEKRGRYFVER